MVVDWKIGLQFLHIELEVVALGELTKLFDEKHCVILLSCQQQIVISETHKKIKFRGRTNPAGSPCAKTRGRDASLRGLVGNISLSQESEHVLL